MGDSTAGETGGRGGSSAGPALKLALAIVQEEDADRVCEDLVDEGLPVTKIASTGGFLRRGNVTLLIGVGDDQLGRVKEIIQARCARRDVPVSASIDETAEAGGAVVFVMSLDELAKF